MSVHNPPNKEIVQNYYSHLYSFHPTIYHIVANESTFIPSYYHPSCVVCRDYKQFFLNEASQSIIEYKINQLCVKKAIISCIVKVLKLKEEDNGSGVESE